MAIGCSNLVFYAWFSAAGEKATKLVKPERIASYNELSCTRNNEISFPLNSIAKQEQEEIVVELKHEGMKCY